MMLCDAAAVADGKLYVHGGGWTHLWAPDTPTNMALAVLIAVLGTGRTSSTTFGQR